LRYNLQRKDGLDLPELLRVYIDVKKNTKITEAKSENYAVKIY
jgi:hypothetical protein